MNKRSVEEMKNKIQTHLFVICPNNSGSTYLKNVLATCKNTWNLQREGQNTIGFVGPNRFNPMGIHPLLWAATEDDRHARKNPKHYDWEKTKSAWYLQAFSKTEQATVFVEKSPPFLLQVETLVSNFVNAKFLLMVRNPYAMAEGILRRYREQDCIKRTARHVISCFEYQKENCTFLAKHPHLFFSYEDLCEHPESIEKKIKALLPELDDLVLYQKIKVKGMYDKYLTNMNDQQIHRLTSEQFKGLTAAFSRHEALFNAFGYTI